MLGELVKEEILHIEHEKKCECARCAVSASIRSVNIFGAKSSVCSCPVCSECRSALAAQAIHLQEMVEKHNELDDEIEAMKKSPIILPNANDMFRQHIVGNEVLRTLAWALGISVKLYAEICHAAHYAYECVESGTIATVNKEIENAAQRLFKKVTEFQTDQPPSRNPHDVN